MYNETVEGKKKFIHDVEKVIVNDPRSHVEKIEYAEDKYYQLAVITYKGGHEVYININHTSNGGIMKDIVNEIYGSGAEGKVWPYEINN